jgi:hypothetical protein
MTESQRKRIEEAALEECELAYKWASIRMKKTDPAISYEYGVRAGFKQGAEFALKMIESDEAEVSNIREAEWKRESESGGV